MTKSTIILNVVNNTNEEQIAVLFNNNDLSTSSLTNKFEWNVTSFSYTQQNIVSIQSKLNNEGSFTLYQANVLIPNKQGVVAALNTLNIGTFYYYTQGSQDFIAVYSLTRSYGTLDIYNNTNTLSLTFDSISNVPVSNPNSLSEWNTFFDTSNNADEGFHDIIVSSNTVNLSGAINLKIIDNLFNSNQNIVSINDIGTVSEIGGQSFFNCNNLISIDFNYCNNLGNSCFSSCATLSSIKFDVLELIGIGSFSGTSITSLTSSNLPMIKIIGNSSFQGCTSLLTVNLPLCETISDLSFESCSNITSVNLPNVLSIGDESFGGCLSMTTISMGSVITIDNEAMSSCISLTNIYIPNCLNLGSTTGNNNVFDLISGNNITLTIPLSTSTDGDVVYLQANNTVTLITT